MGYTVEVNHPHFPADYEMNVGGLGLIPNGSSTEVDEDAERLFILQHGVTVEEGFVNDAIVNSTGSSTLDTTEIDDLVAASGLAPEPEVAPEDAFTTPDTPTTPPSDPITPPADTTDSGTTDTSGGGI
jgi:hypothetical protein